MRFGLLAVFVLSMAFAGSPMAAPITFSTVLTGPGEEPPNSSTATAFGVVTIDPVAHILRVETSFGGLTSGVTASHIHVINGPNDPNTSDTTGPVATRTPTFLNFPSGVTFGGYNMQFNSLDAATYNNPSWISASAALNPSLTPVQAAELELFNGITSGRAYLNIHTTQFPNGEIRGFLEPVPEPATITGVAAALGLALLARRRFKA